MSFNNQLVLIVNNNFINYQLFEWEWHLCMNEFTTYFDFEITVTSND